MTACLLDANVLIALSVAEHEFHDRAQEWLSGIERFAVSPIVEGALVRFVLRVGEGAIVAAELVSRIRAHPRCEFWADDLSYQSVDLSEVRGHRQVTDAYLAELALLHSGQLATFDQALAESRPGGVHLIS